MKESELQSIVMSCLMDNYKKGAAKLLWPWIVQNEQSDRIWDALESNDYLAIMGHGSASKTFTCAQWFVLDWWQASNETALIVTSDTIASMDRRVWSDIKMLFEKARVKMIGDLVDSKRIIFSNPSDAKNTIAGIAAESDNAQSKIQGIHTKRVRVLIDEADNDISRSIWGAIPNLQTSGQLKVCALANPDNRTSDFAMNCEPVNGWNSINPELDTEWESRTKWHVLRLDGLKSPNIVSGTDKYPFLLTNKAVDIIREKEGTNSPEWWKYVRAWYPTDTVSNTVFSPDVLQKARSNKIVWYADITPISACDPAFEGGDDCIQVFGYSGRLADNPNKTAIQITKFLKIKRENPDIPVTIDFGNQLIRNCKDFGVDPSRFGIDSSGNALGLSDYIKHTWSKEVKAISFGGSATGMRITDEDSMVASDRFDRFVTELWFVAREWCKFGLVEIKDCPHDLIVQLEARKYTTIGQNKVKIEKKEDMKKRGFKSPDMADALCLLFHVERLNNQGFKPSMTESYSGKKRTSYRNVSVFAQKYK